MRWIYLAVIILFAAATIIFALQNFETVTISFLGFNARVPLALLAAVASGDLTPSEASEVGKLIDAYVKAIEVTDVLARLEKLEQRR